MCNCVWTDDAVHVVRVNAVDRAACACRHEITVMHSTMPSNHNATQHASATHVLKGQLAAQGARLLVTQVGGQVPK